jgi:hypothetical protein
LGTDFSQKTSVDRLQQAPGLVHFDFSDNSVHRRDYAAAVFSIPQALARREKRIPTPFVCVRKPARCEHGGRPSTNLIGALASPRQAGRGPKRISAIYAEQRQLHLLVRRFPAFGMLVALII